MKNIIIDSNILFKAFRGKNSTIRDKLYNPDVNFYAPNFLVVEIFKHKERIVKASKIREGEVYELLEKILQRINLMLVMQKAVKLLLEFQVGLAMM